MSKRICLCLSLLMVSSSVMATYIDPQSVKLDKERTATFVKYCAKANSWLDCTSKVEKKYLKKLPARGTDAYAKIHYSDFTKQQADAKIKELFKISKVAESGYPEEPGELTVDMLRTEGMWIEHHIFKRDSLTLWPFTLSNGKVLAVDPTQ